MVSLLIFGMLSAAGVAVMAYAADNQGIVHARMERLGEFQRARAVLKADLSQVAARRARRADGSAARDALVGGRPGESGPLLGFVRRGWANPDAEPRASMQYLEYRLVDKQLERSARASLDGAVLGTPQVLLTGIESASIAYHQHDQWSDGWSGGAEALPDAIELTMQLDGLGTIRQRFLLPATAP